jgi:hypothetical protein
MLPTCRSCWGSNAKFQYLCSVWSLSVLASLDPNQIKNKLTSLPANVVRATTDFVVQIALNIMTRSARISLAAALLLGGATVAVAQNGPPTGTVSGRGKPLRLLCQGWRESGGYCERSQRRGTASSRGGGEYGSVHHQMAERTQIQLEVATHVIFSFCADSEIP